MESLFSVMDETERTILTLRSLYLSHGYKRYKMDKFEDYDLYGQNQSFLVSDRLISFTDGSGRLKALKPDVTLSVLQNCRDLNGGLQKYCYNESVYRMGPDGSFREIPQTGIECIGQVDEACLLEVLTLAGKTLRSLSETYVLSVSELTLLSSLVRKAAADQEDAAMLLTAAAERSLAGIDEILVSGKASGERLDAAKRLKALLTLPQDPDAAMALLHTLVKEEAEKEAAARMGRLLDALDDAGIRAEADFTIAGDLHYYNGIVFKGFLKDVPESVLSGGQYGGLMKRMGLQGEAAGFAVYLDRLSWKGGGK
ncbi:MAG: ATP phosphoribosyltransferase regulatory subunit [Lachnospiraceae bacterium]|nr:ATP phosphoribosyltransferase regulatory subunit [Lachnospiraceae bacterium]